MKIQSVTGTRDVLPEEQKYWRLIEKKIYDLTTLYGYQRVDPPIFEKTELFVRGVGDTTDIVEKEMYTFLDKGEHSLTLRPEFTAGVMRLYLENGMHTRPKPVKLFSMGPVFRYERPQAGRFRQHNQFNVEVLGEQDPAVDMEVMSLAWDLYAALGFQGLTFQLNSTGCPVCRPGYTETLKQYYRNHYEEICDDCRRRLDRNPLRLLDCKVPGCQVVSANAPVITDHLCQECEDHFDQLRSFLDAEGRSYEINHRLVRGLDYYTKTVFEVWVEGIGSQNAMCGGGRYDGLIEQLGGPRTPGIGFGSGIERIILSMKEQGLEPEPLAGPEVFIAHQGDSAREYAIRLTYELRRHNMATLTAFGQRSFKSQLREANRHNVKAAVILGEDEMTNRVASVKVFESGEQISVPLNDLVETLARIE